jgi:acyl carrier protein
MTTTSTLSRTELTAAFAEVLEEVAGTPTDTVTESATFYFDLDIDSLTMVEVVVACEERFDVRIPDEALEGLKTVGDALDLIAKAGT